MGKKETEQAILIYGSKYKLWRDGKYLGVATWTKDENVGDSFQRPSETIKGLSTVFVADKWALSQMI